MKDKKELSNMLNDPTLDFLTEVGHELQSGQPVDPGILYEYVNVINTVIQKTLKLETAYNELLTEVKPAKCDHDTAGIYRTGYDAGYAKGWTNCAVNFWATIKETTWNLRSKFNPDGEKK